MVSRNAVEKVILRAYSEPICAVSGVRERTFQVMAC